MADDEAEGVFMIQNIHGFLGNALVDKEKVCGNGEICWAQIGVKQGRRIVFQSRIVGWRNCVAIGGCYVTWCESDDAVVGDYVAVNLEPNLSWEGEKIGHYGLSQMEMPGLREEERMERQDLQIAG
jgi:hypothetical protein